MNIHLVVDKGQAIWAVQQAVRKYSTFLKGKGLMVSKDDFSPSVINAMLETKGKSPANAINGTGVIYLRGEFPEEYLPMFLGHEELHLLLNDILTEELGNPMKASGFSRKLVDSISMRRFVYESFGLDFMEVTEFLMKWSIANTPRARIAKRIVKIIRGGLNAIQKIFKKGT